MREYSVGKRLIQGYCVIVGLNRNSAELGKNILSEVTLVIGQV